MPVDGLSPLPGPVTPSVRIFENKSLASEAAAQKAAEILRECIAAKGGARILVGTGNSQLEMVGFLTRQPGVDWSRIDAFHLDEYVGIGADHPASFRLWIRKNFAEKARPRSVHYLEGDASDLEAVIDTYERLLMGGPIDLAFVGIGENGHIAFNDPPVADFADPRAVKRVALDEACRRQQVGEGHFAGLASVPREALTVTCTGLFRAGTWICCVPDRRKAQAVRNSLEGPVTTACPGSLVQKHPNAAVFLDSESAALLSPSLAKVWRE